METIVSWKDPSKEPPPFDKVIWAMIGYKSTHDCGLSWQEYLDPYPLIISTDSPNDSGSQSEIERFVRDGTCFNEHQFFITDRHGDMFKNIELKSDAIVAWAELPDFIALLEIKN